MEMPGNSVASKLKIKELNGQERPVARGGHKCGFGGEERAEALVVRERRAQLIEDIAYKLTDLITIISGRVELLSESVPSIHIKDLQEIRQTALKGVVFSELLLRSVQACRKEMGI